MTSPLLENLNEIEDAYGDAYRPYIKWLLKLAKAQHLALEKQRKSLKEFIDTYERLEKMFDYGGMGLTYYQSKEALKESDELLRGFE